MLQVGFSLSYTRQVAMKKVFFSEAGNEVFFGVPKWWLFITGGTSGKNFHFLFPFDALTVNNCQNLYLKKTIKVRVHHPASMDVGRKIGHDE